MFHLTTYSTKETQKLGAKIGERILRTKEPVLFYGDLGVGKTQLVQGLSRELGVKKIVKSPTYTLKKIYQGLDIKLIHYDLYRLGGNEEIDFMSLEEDLMDENVLVVIEWADRISKDLLPPEALIVNLQFVNQYERHISINFCEKLLPSLGEIKQLWEEYSVPDNIKKHMFKVAEIAYEISEKLIRNGVIVNSNLVKKAGLLHDLTRFIDLDTSNHHERTAGEAIRERGWSELLVQAVVSHRAETILLEPSLRTWEEKIVYLADKYVLHDKQVTLKERFNDSLLRHFKGKTTPEREETIRQCYKLESEINKI